MATTHTTLPREVRYQLGALSRTADRTVRRWWEGLPVRGATALALETAAKTIGLTRPLPTAE